MTSEVFREQNAALNRKSCTLLTGGGLGDRKISSVSAASASTSGYLSSPASFSSDRKVSVGVPNQLQDRRVTSISSPERKTSGSERGESRTSSVSSQSNVRVPTLSRAAAFDNHRRESHSTAESGSSFGHPHNPHVQRKFINTWKQACDKTRERTKDLIKRWRTLPEDSPTYDTPEDECRSSSAWSHSLAEWKNVELVANLGDPMTSSYQESEWWRCRTYPGSPPPPLVPLSPEQRVKLAQLFNTLLDTDSDSLVSADDFHSLAERLIQFAGWKEHGPQACTLREVVIGLLEAFMLSLHTPDLDNESPMTELRSSMSYGLFLGLDDWLSEWSNILRGAKGIQDMPLWLQYFPKVLFAAINRSASGVVSKEELRFFYTSFLGFDSRKVDEALGPAYRAMTANGDHKLNVGTYKLVFANFLLGRNPNGPGQFVFGPFGEAARPCEEVVFPVDYSAMNSLPEDLEEYSPGRKSNRRSVVV
ncbi:uncharacterized protein LOC132202862 isoform X2 [Neocloeon triangulifer]|uniref:uncharacterized protein LOC132202862 isoform X2 n=1 Tax=Neocloeon triangulifer TaxID=2078957 RepID=UPI00286F5275|nr:uncharacterized protein LOC132202862 isoform X2 [Neocloeon triangulifer]